MLGSRRRRHIKNTPAILPDTYLLVIVINHNHIFVPTCKNHFDGLLLTNFLVQIKYVYLSYLPNFS